MTHVIWDWNGTLLDDTQAAVEALNVMLVRRGLAPIDICLYRDVFAFPVRPFYERIGFRLEDEDWDALAVEYHDCYAVQPKALNETARDVLEQARRMGARQSVVSALRQDLLESAITRHGIEGYMDNVFGVDNLNGSSKLSRARELVAKLVSEGAALSDLVMIGDAIHDKEVADSLGVRCVLCAQGSHAAWRLRAAGQTEETLLAALRRAMQRDDLV